MDVRVLATLGGEVELELRPAALLCGVDVLVRLAGLKTLEE
jgi:hypothetical protein